jgi:hypothetical protein
MNQPNEYLTARLDGIRASLLAQHLGGRGLPNSTIGSERETFLREFLAKVFPSNFRFTRGAITDSNGLISGQIDIAVEYPFLPSFPMPTSEERLLLAESVAAIIEVKSDLVGQWSQVQSTVRAVKPLKRKWKGSTSLRGGAIGFDGDSESSIPIIAVGYRGHTTLDGLQQRMDTTPELDRPDAAFVIDSGCFTGLGCTAHGVYGLYGFCIVLSRLTAAVAAAESDILAYVNNN